MGFSMYLQGEATRKISLETLPPVLTLHLKRFIYDKEGGSLKIDKEVQYHTDLVIGKGKMGAILF